MEGRHATASDQPIERNGAWWLKHADGTWLRWVPAQRTWVADASTPPPPPAPPPAGVQPTPLTPIASPYSPRAPITRGARPIRTFGFADLNPRTKMIAAVALVSLLGVGAFAAFARGSESDEAPAPSAGKTNPAAAARAAFIARADAICKKENAYEMRVFERTTPSSPSELVTFIDTVMPHSEAMMRKLRALEPPPGEAKHIRRLWIAGDAVLDGVRAMRSQAAAGDTSGLEAALARTLKVNARFDAMALQVGLRECSNLTASST